VGRQKFHYDVWGDTINVASLMESHGLPDRIQVTEAVYERLKTAFVFERRGFIEVKGKGSTLTYLLVGRVNEVGSCRGRARGSLRALLRLQPPRPRSRPAPSRDEWLFQALARRHVTTASGPRLPH
jgi:hypothetical protein